MNASCYQYGIDCPLPLTGLDLLPVVFLGLVLCTVGLALWWAHKR